jgi:hypothetical protein
MIRALPAHRGRRVLVVVGSDYAQYCGSRPCVSEGNVRELAVREGVVIYGIVNRSKPPPMQIGGFPIEKMSAATGGGYLFLKRSDKLGMLMAQVLDELRHEYLLGFTPALADDHDHTLRVEVTRPSHRATARITQRLLHK